MLRKQNISPKHVANTSEIRVNCTVTPRLIRSLGRSSAILMGASIEFLGVFFKDG
jgi:hypothetical protein